MAESYKTILVLTSTFPRWKNDTEPAFIYELCERLGHSFKIIVLAPDAPGAKSHEFLNGVEVYRYKYFFKKFQKIAYQGGILSNLNRNKINYLMLPIFFISQALFIIKLLRRYKVSLIHAHWVLPQAFISVIIRLFFSIRIPVLCTLHGGDLFAKNNVVVSGIMAWTLKKCEHITVVSNAMVDEIVNLGVDRNRISVLSMGVDLLNLFLPRDKCVRDSSTILFVGRLVEKKGVKYLLEALKLVLSRNSQVRLVVIGDGPERKHLESLSVELGIKKNVEFAGSLVHNELAGYYQTATLAVFPFVVADSGDQEGLGLVVVEAMGCMCPVIVSELSVVEDIINDGENGVLVKPGDTKAIAEKILYILNNREISEEMGIKGRQSVLSKYDWTVISDNHAELYLKIVNLFSYV